jgi:hypothetical protein
MEFATTIICEINDKFPHRSILSAMNSIEWPKNKESLNDYSEKELEELTDIYGIVNARCQLLMLMLSVMNGIILKL